MFKKYSQKTFLILITIIFNIFFTQKNAKADFERKVIWGMEATINDKPIELLYYDSNFCDNRLGWTSIDENTFSPPQKWVDDNKKNFFSQEAIINLHQLDPTIKASMNIKDYEVNFYFPGILINKDVQLDEKSDDKITIKRIYIKIDNTAVFISKKEFEKIKNSYSGFFKITAKVESPEYYMIDDKPSYITKSEFKKLVESDNNNIKNAYSMGSPIEVTRSLIFLYSDKKYSQNEFLKIIKIEANSILKPEGDYFDSKQYPPKKLIKEYNLIRKNLKYFKEILLEKYGIIVIDFINSRC